MSSFYWIILAQHTSLPTNHLTNPNSQTIVNSSLSLSPALQTTLPPELKFTRLCLSFHCQYILFHQNQLNILLANLKLLEHYDNTWCVTNSALFSQLLPDLASNCASCSIETISTITSQLQVLCAVKLQIHSGIQWPQYLFDRNSVVSNHSCHCPLCALSSFFILSRFCLSLSTIPCFEECLRRLQWVSGMLLTIHH